jgi:hypothetical protein
VVPDTRRDHGQGLAEYGANTQPSISEVLNMPPRKPAPSEIAAAISLVTSRTSRNSRPRSWSNSAWMAPCPPPQHLRDDERHHGDQQAADRRAQPLRQGQAAQPSLRPGSPTAMISTLSLPPMHQARQTSGRTTAGCRAAAATRNRAVEWVKRALGKRGGQRGPRQPGRARARSKPPRISS